MNNISLITTTQHLVVISSILAFGFHAEASEVKYKDMFNTDWISLSGEFSSMVSSTTRAQGKRFENPGDAPKAAPEAFSLIDGITYNFHGGFICRNELSWSDSWMPAFWKYRFNRSALEISEYRPEGDIHKSAQQVDSAEASTIAVPPSKPSGSPR